MSDDNILSFPSKEPEIFKRQSLYDIQETLTQYLEAVSYAIEAGEDSFNIQSPDGRVLTITPDILVVMFSDGRNIAQDGLESLNAIEMLALRESLLGCLED